MQISYASNFSGLTGRAWWETDEGDFENRINRRSTSIRREYGLDLGHRYRHPDAGDRIRWPGKGSRRLHEAVQGSPDLFSIITPP